MKIDFRETTRIEKSKLHTPVIFQIYNSKSPTVVAEIHVWDNN